MLHVQSDFTVFVPPLASSFDCLNEMEGSERIPWMERAVKPAIISRQAPYRIDEPVTRIRASRFLSPKPS